MGPGPDVPTLPEHQIPTNAEGTPTPKAQRNFTDADSRIMKTGDGFVQGYNCQAMVDTEHQIIVAQAVTNQPPDVEHLASAPVKPLLAIEWFGPGEGEDTAALRLLGRLPDLYGSRFFDILLLDSLYPQAPVLKLASKIGWDLVVTLKQERRELYQNAMALFQHRAADHQYQEHQVGKRTEVEIWETDGLPFTVDYPEPVRVVQSQEKVTQSHRRRDRLTSETTEHKWVWITTLDRQAFPGPLVRQLGHDRWKNGNNSWNDLTQNWALKHGFLHACQHRPRGEDQNQQRRPVPSIGV